MKDVSNIRISKYLKRNLIENIMIKLIILEIYRNLKL